MSEADIKVIDKQIKDIIAEAAHSSRQPRASARICGQTY